VAVSGVLRVVIADDHAPTRSGVRDALEQQSCCVVAEAATAAEALTAAREHRPDVCLLDINMPGSGIVAAAEITHTVPDVAVVMLTASRDDEDLFAALRAGASGYLLKDSATSELLQAVRDLHAGRGHFGPYAARVIADQVHQPRRDLDDPYGRLTPREREVFHLLIEGRTTKEVARALDISIKTAENHRAHVLEKLAAHNVADLVRYAVRKGLLGRGGVA
jgi:two-component system, NarL family, response regulator NreC